MTLPSSGPLSLSDIQGEFGGSNPIGMNEYYAGGGLVPSGTTGTYGAVPTSGQISVQNFYGTSNYIPVYIEDIFSTWLYTGNGATQTITNGINLSGSGGLVWIKGRNGSAAPDHLLYDTSRGVTNGLVTNSSGATYTNANTLTAFTSSGFSVGSYIYVNGPPSNPPFPDSFVSWTFRKQPKFFDVVTYTGDGSYTRSISHALGSTPGCVIIKRLDGSGDWYVWHRSIDPTYTLYLNATNSPAPIGVNWSPNSSTFTATTQNTTNNSGYTYVAYLFAHDAGGFGLTGTDNVITCGSVTGSQVVNLGYEPQWVLSKCSGSAGQDWTIVDNMRGAPTPASGYTPYSSNLMPNLSNTESTTGVYGASVIFNSTGFRLNPNTTVATTYIYIAIRRGPMKVPTTGTTVFSPNAVNVPMGTQITTGFPVDTTFPVYRSGQGPRVEDRLRGISTSTTDSTTEYYLSTPSTAAESNSLGFTYGWNNTGFLMNAGYANAPDVFWSFRRAPEFFDMVCYTGNSAGTNSLSHNLKTQPLLVIAKSRNNGGTGWNWPAITNSAVSSQATLLLNNSTGNLGGSSSGMLTSTTVDVGVSTGLGSLYGTQQINQSGVTYVMYLFASCTGVSKVGSYTGTGALQTVNCNFTTGARFVMIKRADSNGSWYVWDSARGISSGDDPYLLMNSGSAEITGTNYVDTTSVGFQVTAAAPSDLNASGGTYIFLAIA